MKILYILKSEPDETVKRLIEAHEKSNEVKVVTLTKGLSYDDLVDDIFGYDKVITW